MDYTNIIMDLMNRVCILENKVKVLESKLTLSDNDTNSTQGAVQLNEVEQKTFEKVSTADVRNYIIALKQQAKNEGKYYIDIVCNDIHKALKLKNRIPVVCNAMNQVMGEKDIILHKTPSGYSSTLAIRYFL